MLDSFTHNAQLEQWLKTPLGQAMINAERRLIMRRLEHCMGDRLLQLSISDELDLCEGNRLYHAFKLSPNIHCDNTQAQALFEQLPLPEDSVDVVVIHHVLEFAPNPHQILREVHRVLSPNGKLFVVGITPFSALAARLRTACWLGRRHFKRQSIGSSRLQDWLKLLQMPTLGTQYGFHQLPINQHKALSGQTKPADFAQQHSLPFGGVFMLEAVKQVHGMTPIKPKRQLWRPELSRLNPAAMPAPSTKTIH